ncbi:D-glycero-alpha-D-manno-heptose-7-phosphate kinase [Aneurinibacillus soli]|uniref:D-glycero-alpha-D-manno-heptose 7-phosphate kinase n=1 Tax=Aneurinibacillus soli TaxID=1500254 RepID=A0A0U4WCG9_9BACL|nr:dehydrogenase [Aneurinibacillus soli]PYE61540.1 D-glycero-alpha-D-manno-heptose-7-phosphate kinase [Aneurinibacillus soli]BAU26505.1 D-glycero-alpha-D-manno-heptose 7-phosphate kinase [Aneurinibacillus soli]
MIFRSKAPLRLGLAGGGTDVSPYSDEYGGYVLNATIDMYAYCTIEVTTSNQLSFYAADRDEIFECEARSCLELDGVLDLHKGIYNRIVKQFNNGEPLSFNMTTYSDAPAGSGLGSSSTMVVAILKAFVEWLNLPLGEYDVAHLAYEIERVDVGLSGGKQDQYAATFGGFNFIEFYSEDRVIVNPLRVKNRIINELENSMALYYTGVSRESAKIIEEQTKNTIEKNSKSLEAMHELKADALLMKEAILKGDVKTFAKYLGKSWEAKKRMASSISNPYLDEIYDVAIRAGAYAGKVSGAGGGGFMMFIVDPVRRIAVSKALNELSGQVMNFHFVKNGTEGWRV